MSTEQKYWCYRGKHEVPSSGFTANYLKPTYNSAGRICKKCMKERSEENKAKRNKLREEQEFFYGIKF